MSDCRFGVSPVNYPDPDPDVKFVHFFAFEAKLLEIEAEDTIRFLYYVQVVSIQKRFVKEKI